MTRSEAIRHNAKIILANVRGKTKQERRNAYRFLALGPVFGPVVVMSAMLSGALKVKEIEAGREG